MVNHLLRGCHIGWRILTIEVPCLFIFGDKYISAVCGFRASLTKWFKPPDRMLQGFAFRVLHARYTLGRSLFCWHINYSSLLLASIFFPLIKDYHLRFWVNCFEGCFFKRHLTWKQCQKFVSSNTIITRQAGVQCMHALHEMSAPSQLCNFIVRHFHWQIRQCWCFCLSIAPSKSVK